MAALSQPYLRSNRAMGLRFASTHLTALKLKKPERWCRPARNADWHAEACLNPDKPTDNAMKNTDTNVLNF